MIENDWSTKLLEGFIRLITRNSATELWQQSIVRNNEFGFDFVELVIKIVKKEKNDVDVLS